MARSSGYLFSPLLANIILEVLATIVRQEKILKHTYRKERNQTVLIVMT